MQMLEVSYKDKIIKFELHRKNVKNINLNLKPDTTITVSANENVPTEFILNFIKEKAPWIIKNISHFKEYEPERKSALEFISGETVKYLGKQYRLKVEETKEKEEVKYYRGYVYIHVKDKKNYNRKEKLFNQWLREKAEENFEASLERVYEIIQKYGIQKPQLQIRSMRARWGSCIKDKNLILLNSELIKAPKYCIDYVVLHELSHFKYRNHDNNFYNFMTSLMPDWKQRKEILDEEVVKEL